MSDQLICDLCTFFFKLQAPFSLSSSLTPVLSSPCCFRSVFLVFRSVISTPCSLVSKLTPSSALSSSHPLEKFLLRCMLVSYDLVWL